MPLTSEDPIPTQKQANCSKKKLIKWFKKKSNYLSFLCGLKKSVVMIERDAYYVLFCKALENKFS